MPAKTFAQLAIENGLLTETQVEECREALAQEVAAGNVRRPVEELVIEKGYMTAEAARALNTALERLARDEGKTEPQKIGGYEIICTIGEGGLGTVYKARQISMGRLIALKVLHKKWLKDEEFKKRFLLEARLAGRLSHQNLIQVFDVGRQGDVLYFSMEYIDGDTVEEITDRDGAMDIDRALNICLQVLRAISYMKRFDIVHRDIKPGNIMLTKSGIAKLGDFGFVKSKFDALLAPDGEVLGTPDYISPEQAMGTEEIDWRSDVYSLGCTLYHMLAGNPPFDGTGSTVMRKHIRAQLPSPREFNPDIPESVCAVLERMMAKNPDDRYQNAEELFEDLEMVKMGQDPKSPRLDAGRSTILRVYKIERQRRDRTETEIDRLKRHNLWMRMAVGIMALIIALLVAAAFFFWAAAETSGGI
jgi:eukaryotic-like serine/threonine-protein kinase